MVFKYARPLMPVTRAGLAVISSVVAFEPASAHPHVWVTVRDTLVIENGKIGGVRHEWTFDEVYTAMAIEGLDKNGDGKYDRDELQELAQTNIDGLKEFGDFTYASVAGMTVPFGKPRDYWLDYTNNILTLHFYLPLETPLAISTPHFRIKVSDPSFFIAFEFDKDHPVKTDGAPANCTAAIVKEQDGADQKDLNQAFATQMTPLGDGGGDTFELVCSK